MADAPKNSKRILDFLLIFALVYLGYGAAKTYLFPEQTPAQSMPVVLQMQDSTVRFGVPPVIIIKNNTNAELTIPDRCPRPVVDVFSVNDQNQLTDITPTEAVGDCMAIDPIPAGKSATVSLNPWKESVFSAPGLYELELPLELDGLNQGTGSVMTGSTSEGSQYREGIIVRFTISEAGVMAKLFRSFITKPLLNALIFIASILPGHNLGWAIIILTLVVKLLLFIPTQHALEGQKKMQLLQPKFEAIRKQHADNPAKMQEETMKIWKEYKVNPFQACLPMLVQFPVLIGLFYVIRDGSHLEYSKHLIYPFYQDLDWTFGHMFFGLDLTKSYVWIFPPILIVLQFIQMRLSFLIADKKKAKQLEKQTTPQTDTPQELQQKIMMYMLPLVIGFFALRYPSALSIYWGFSTLFAIGQQLIVNREHINVRE